MFFRVMCSVLLALIISRADANAWIGDYQCQAGDASARLTITKQDEVYRLDYTAESATLYGVGIDRFGALSVAFISVANHQLAAFGIVRYTRLPNGDLRGEYAIFGISKMGLETCKRVKKENMANGRYRSPHVSRYSSSARSWRTFGTRHFLLSSKGSNTLDEIASRQY